jgi:hypothetical protein
MKITRSFFVIAAFFALPIASIRAEAPASTVLMRPFKAFAEMVQLAPVRETKDENSPVVKLWVRDVLIGSPAYKAGLRKGMFVTQIATLEVKGKTEKQLALDTQKLVVTGDDLVIVATMTVKSDRERHFAVKIPKARRIEVVAQN